MRFEAIFSEDRFEDLQVWVRPPSPLVYWDQRLSGNYKIVYKAQHVTGKILAIKELVSSLCSFYIPLPP